MSAWSRALTFANPCACLCMSCLHSPHQPIYNLCNWLLSVTITQSLLIIKSCPVAQRVLPQGGHLQLIQLLVPILLMHKRLLSLCKMQCDQSAKNGREKKFLLWGSLQIGYTCAWYTILFAISDKFLTSANFRSFSGPPCFQWGKQYFCVLSDIGQNQKQRLSTTCSPLRRLMPLLPPRRLAWCRRPSCCFILS